MKSIMASKKNKFVDKTEHLLQWFLEKPNFSLLVFFFNFFRLSLFLPLPHYVSLSHFFFPSTSIFLFLSHNSISLYFPPLPSPSSLPIYFIVLLVHNRISRTGSLHRMHINQFFTILCLRTWLSTVSSLLLLLVILSPSLWLPFFLWYLFICKNLSIMLPTVFFYSLVFYEY